MRKILKISGITIAAVSGAILLIYLIFLFVNICCNWGLRRYINSFEPVRYEAGSQVEPVFENGYYTFTTDDEFNISFLTDIHIGGGFWTYKKDKKTIYEVITMLQEDKPELVILGGDNVFAVPGPHYNGGFTFNNKMAEKTVIKLFEHEQVYFSTVFGNHDTEAFDYFDRQSVGNLFMEKQFKYCIFDQNFTDPDAVTVPSVTNQYIVIKHGDGTVNKLILLIDTNAYEDTTIQSSVDWLYDTIHPAQIEWAAETLKTLSADAGLPDGEYLKAICFLHIPIGEYQTALDDLITETANPDGTITYSVNPDPVDTVFEDGWWDEELGVCYGGYSLPDKTPNECDEFFEVMAEEMDSVEGIFCGHDHVNCATVYYKGVMLSYGYTLDNIAYDYISEYGAQRGSTYVSLFHDGSFTQQHKNVYDDYNCDPDKWTHTDSGAMYDPKYFRTVYK